MSPARDRSTTTWRSSGWPRFWAEKTMVYAQGVGPLTGNRARKWVARTLGRADAITLRDPDSAQLLESIGIKRPVTVAADPSFLVDPDLEAADRILAGRGVAGRELIGISLRPWPGMLDWLRPAAETLGQISEEAGAAAVVIGMQPREDAEVCGMVPGGVVLDELHGVRAIKGVISRCGLVVGMRLHALMFAASECVPFVPLVYDTKVASFAEMTGQRADVRVGATDPSVLADTIRQAWAGRADIARELRLKTEGIRDMAMSPARIAGNLLGR